MKGKRLGVRGRILLLAILPATVVALGIIITAMQMLGTNIEKREFMGIKSTVVAIREAIECGNAGEYHQDEAGNLLKGEVNISEAISTVDAIKAESDCDITVFWGDTRVLTTI